MVKFLRRIWRRHSKLGKGRKKKQVWRRPRGRDNKMREERRGVPRVVKVGYKKDKKKSEKPVVIFTVNDLEKVSKKDFVVLGKLGKKKKMEIVKKATEMQIPLRNINAKKFLKENEKAKKKPKDEKPKETEKSKEVNKEKDKK